MNIQTIQKELDYYRKFTPVNFKQERERFFAAYSKDTPYNPAFRYHDSLEIEDYGDIKKCLAQQRGKDVIIDAFLDLYQDVSDMMIAWKKADYQTVSMLSGEIFGSTDDLALNNCKKKLKEYLEALSDFEAVHDAGDIAKRFEEEFKKRNFRGWTIEYNVANGGNVSIYEVEKKVVIRTDAKERAPGLECLISHELDGHAFQAFNAMDNDKYREWFLSYIGTERQYEGYATFVEINNLPQAHLLCDVSEYLAFMIAAAIAQEATFYDTFKEMHGLCGDEDFSFYTAYKAKRGFCDTAKPGAFQKESCYLFGAMDIIALVEEDETNFFKLSEGCFPLSVTHLMPARRPTWIGLTGFNTDNHDFIKREMEEIQKG
jgi:hypothetical protein